MKRFRARIVNGQPVLDDRPAFMEAVAAFEGQVIEISFRPAGEIRSLSQNAYYHVLLKALGDRLGYDPQELHQVLKERFLMDYSGPSPVVGSTTQLDTKEFAEYVENVRRLAAEQGVDLPDPDRGGGGLVSMPRHRSVPPPH